MSDPLTLALTLAAVAGAWLLLCSAVAVGNYLANLALLHALHVRVARQEPAAQSQEGKAA